MSDPTTSSDKASPPKRTGILRGVAERDPARLSAVLYVSAWVVEAMAVLAGLIIAVGMTTKSLVGTVDAAQRDAEFYLNALAATIPFFLVAVVEATKIPVAGAAYSARTPGWRLVFTGTLLFLSLITFETMLNGLERNFTALTREPNELRKEMIFLKEENSRQEQERSTLSETTDRKIEKEFAEGIKRARDARDKDVRAATRIKTDLKANVLTETIQGYKDEVTRLKEEEQEIRAERKQALSQLGARLEQAIRQDNSERADRLAAIGKAIQGQTESLARAKRERTAAIQDANFLFRAGVTEEHNERVTREQSELSRLRQRETTILQDESPSPVDAARRDEREQRKEFSERLSAIGRKITEKNVSISQAIALAEQGVKPQLAIQDEEIGRINKRYEEAVASLEEERANDKARLAIKTKEIERIDRDLQERRQKLTELRKNVNRVVEETQVYRLALRFSPDSESAADVPESRVALVAGIWFGSLAAVVAFTGVLLALASYVIGDTEQASDKNRRSSRHGLGRLIASGRRALIGFRRRIREPKVKIVQVDRAVPKEVIKEVPVDKVVIKEVPVEIIQKEIVHVPMYTSDSKLLNRRGPESEPEDS